MLVVRVILLTLCKDYQLLRLRTIPILDHKLSWHAHLDYICNKANHLLAFLNRNLPAHNQRLRKHIVTSN